MTDNSIAYVGNPTNSPRKVGVRNNGDPRNYSRVNKESRLNNISNKYNNSAADEEARKYAMDTKQGVVWSDSFALVKNCSFQYIRTRMISGPVGISDDIASKRGFFFVSLFECNGWLKRFVRRNTEGFG